MSFVLEIKFIFVHKSNFEDRGSYFLSFNNRTLVFKFFLFFSVCFILSFSISIYNLGISSFLISLNQDFGIYKLYVYPLFFKFSKEENPFTQIVGPNFEFEVISVF